MKNTNCEKCIFSDYIDSSDPCVMGIIDQIKDSKSLITNDQKFYSIVNYLCPYAFSMKIYDENKEEIGSIDNLKRSLYLRNQISYYLIIFLEDNDPKDIVNHILELPIKPGFVSIITYEKNNTHTIIDCLRILDKKDIKWKLHNMLEKFDYQQSISVALDTNPMKNLNQFLWINSASSYNLWSRDILNINNTVMIKQPIASALYRNKENTDGLFISLKAYDEIRYEFTTDITSALKQVDNSLIKYYA